LGWYISSIVGQRTRLIKYFKRVARQNPEDSSVESIIFTVLYKKNTTILRLDLELCLYQFEFPTESPNAISHVEGKVFLRLQSIRDG
jgi:hypothetical protein